MDGNSGAFFLPLPDHDMDMHTAYIQAALDKCREEGGVLRLAPGDWRIASLRLYDNTALYLSSGTPLLASNRWQDYTDFHVPTTLGYLKSPFLQKRSGVCRIIMSTHPLQP